MSAIFGVVGDVTSSELKAMGERLSHRGSIATWEEVAPRVYLGRAASQPRSVHRRNGLSAVVDLSAAVDSGTTEDDVFNTYVERGLAGIESLRVAVAVAAWDEQTHTLRLTRDFVGQKPLHYCRLADGGMAFATEYKALLALNALPAEPDLDALQYMQCYKRTPPGRTLLKRVYTSPPGATLRISATGASQSQEDMQSLHLDVRSVSEDVACNELVQRIVGAIRSVVADKRRVGISLSGGIDSMSVAFACRSCAPDAELVGFTAGHGPGDPEIDTAAIVMERLGGHHQPVIVKAEPLIELLPDAVWFFENPVGRTEPVQLLELGRAAHAAGFDWLLGGFSADALFAGMPKDKLLWLSQLLPPLRKDILEFYDLSQSGRKSQRPGAWLMERVYFHGSLPAVPRIRDAQFVAKPSTFPAPGPEFLNHVLVDEFNEHVSRSLVRYERPLQAFGVDFATPFHDRAVMDYAFTLPSRLKIRRGREKYILRRAMQSLVSPDLLNMPKGISRIRHDQAFAEILRQLAELYLSPEQVRRRGWFDIDHIQSIRRRLSGKRYHTETAMRLWTVIVTEIWGQIYLDRRGQRPTRR